MADIDERACALTLGSGSSPEIFKQKPSAFQGLKGQELRGFTVSSRISEITEIWRTYEFATFDPTLCFALWRDGQPLGH